MTLLIREENQAGGYILLWTYDDAGNILTRRRYSYANGTAGYPLETVNYGYGNANWGDLLTSYDGQNITYDTVGNPLSYYNGTRWSFTWEHGRELATMTNSGITWTNTYDANGMRTQRTNGSTAYQYVYNGSSLSRMTMGNNILDFLYDAEGSPMAVVYNGTYYYYITNAQGDVTAILNSSGNTVVTYTYNAWGKPTSTTGTMAATLGTLNPLRYRGYVYDTETGFYYVSSRYYDPEIGRWINADSQLNTSLGVLGCNMFAYCLNNPVNKVDYGGNKPGDLFDTMDEAALDFAMCYNALSIADMQEYGSAIYMVPKVSITYPKTPWYLLILGIRYSLKVTVAIKYS